MKKVTKIFAVISFQIGVNVIGLPCFHQIETDKISRHAVKNTNKFTN